MNTRQHQVLQALKNAGSKGLTVKDSMDLNIGTEARKRISELRRMGHEITEKWEQSGNRRFKRYWLTKEYTEPKKPHYVWDNSNNIAWECNCYSQSSHNA